MSLTFADIVERLKRIDEVSLLEVLNISAEDIVERFEDKIRERWDRLEADLEDPEDEV